MCMLAWGRERHGWKRLFVPTFFCQDVLRTVARELPIELYSDAPDKPPPAHVEADPTDVLLVVNFLGMRSNPQIESHAVLSRYAARDVVRRLALVLLDGVPLTSERFKEVIAVLKDLVGLGSRELFHPIRLALAGRAGGGDLDRVILLLDEAAALSFAVPVKPARERILEFCAALD